MNTKKQGDIGVAAAMLYFTKIGYAVSKPIADSQRYDLIVDDGKKLYRVECKSGNFRDKSGAFKIQLATKGGNKSCQTTTKFSSSDADLLFITTLSEDGFDYLIPAGHVDGHNTVTLGSKYDQFRL